MAAIIFFDCSVGRSILSSKAQARNSFISSSVRPWTNVSSLLVDQILRGGTHMNALEILKQDHQKVKQLFQEATHASDQRKRKEIFDKIDTELEIHAHIEETVFYPAWVCMVFAVTFSQ
jgi:hypothetical protein